MKRAGMLIALMMLMDTLSFSATPTPIPAPYTDMAVSVIAPSATSVTIAIAEATKVYDPAVYGQYKMNLYKSSSYTNPEPSRFDFETMKAVSWQPTPRILTVQRAQDGTKASTWKAGAYSLRRYDTIPTVTPTATPVDTATPTPTATHTNTPTYTPVDFKGYPVHGVPTPSSPTDAVNKSYSDALVPTAVATANAFSAALAATMTPLAANAVATEVAARQTAIAGNIACASVSTAQLTLGDATPELQQTPIPIINVLESIDWNPINYDQIRTRSVVSPSSDGTAVDAFDASFSVLGSYNYNHVAGYQDRPQITLGASNSITTSYGFYSFPKINSGTLLNRYAFYVGNTTGSGSVSNNVGLFVEALTGASPYAIYSAGTTVPSYLGGGLGLGSNLKDSKLQVAGNVEVDPGDGYFINTYYSSGWKSSMNGWCAGYYMNNSSGILTLSIFGNNASGHASAVTETQYMIVDGSSGNVQFQKPVSVNSSLGATSFTNSGPTSLVGSLSLKTGANTCVGAVTLTAGAASVTTTCAVTGSKIFVSLANVNGGTPGYCSASASTSIVSFAGLGTDTGIYNYWVINTH